MRESGLGGGHQPRGAGRFERRSALGLLALVVGAVPFLALLLLVRERWALLRGVDHGVADGLNRFVAPYPAVVDGLQALTELGGVLGAAYVLSLTTAFLLIRRRRRLAAYVITTGLGLLVLVPLTKVLVGRDRPRVPVPVTDLPVTDSFPSGHAAATAALAVAAVLTVRGTRALLLAAAAGALLVVGASTAQLALALHHPSDLAGGWLWGAAWTTAVWAASGRPVERHET